MLFIYIILNVYLLWRINNWFRRILPFLKNKWIHAIWLPLYCALACTVFGDLFLPESLFSKIIYKTGNMWIGVMIYLILFTAFADLSVVVHAVYCKIKKSDHKIHNHTYYIVGSVVIILSTVLTIYGSIHMNNIKIHDYDVSVNKHVEGISDLNVVLAADIHIGHTIDTKMVEQFVEKINSLEPDIVILAGDIFNNDFDDIKEPLKIRNLLKSIKSEYGCYAVYGNHDVTEPLVGGFSVYDSEYPKRDPRMEEMLKAAGIRVLMDETIQICDDKVVLSGRLDGEKTGNDDPDRMSPGELLSGIDCSKPVFMIDHEPSELQENADSGVDICFSGHTHAGQFFPLTVTSPLAWDNDWGIMRVDNMYSIVTCGVGVYGPALRVGTDSEIMNIRVHFN